MVRTRSRQRKAQDAGTSPPAVHALSGWAGLHDDLLAQILHSVMAEASVASLKGWAAVLSTCASWRALAKQMPIDAACPPSAAVLAWLRRIRVRSLCFQHSEAAPLGDLTCQGFTCSEQRYRAAISTLLATTEFISHSASTLQELSGVHPREGILCLSPFRALQRISMTGAVSETCMLRILHGLPLLSEVVAAGYGEYHIEGLPASVKRLDLQWATQPGATFSTIAFHLPPHCALRELSLSSQRPLCLPSASLARCTVLRLAARRVYLGLPLRPGAPWLDVDALAARFAEFMLGSPLEVIEVTATRCFVFQPVQEAFDLSTNDGVGGLAQQDQLATVLLARHFQSLHVEQRLLAAGAFRAFVCITRRRAEPMAFSFQAPLNAEQLNFLQQHALATSISFGPSALADSLAVLNCPAFAERNGALLQQLQNLELSSILDLSPYSALQSIHGVWHNEPLAALGPAQLTSLRLTPALGAQQAQRCFGSRWLAGVKSLGSVTLVRFATADFSHLQAAPASVQISSMQPPGGLVAPHTLQLPAAGFGPACSLSLRMAYAPPHAIHGGAAAAAGLNAYNNNGQVVGPGMLAVALQQQAAAMAGLAQEAAAVAAPGAAAAAPEQQAAHAAMAQQAADAEAVAALAGEMLAEAQAAIADQQQQQQQEAEQHEEDLLGFAEQALQLAHAGPGGDAAAAGAAAAEVIDLVSEGEEEEEEEEGEQGGAQVAAVGAGQQPGAAVAVVVAPHPAGGGGNPDAAAAAALEWFGVEEMQDAEAALEAAEAAQQLQQGADQGHPAGQQHHQQHHLPLQQAALAGGGGGAAQALGQEGMPALVDSSSDDEDEPMPALDDELMLEEVEGEVVDGGLDPGLQAGLPGNDGLGPWVIVPPPPPQQQEGGGAAGGGDDQQQQQQQQHAAAAAAGGAQGQQGGMEFAQPWAMPDDLLSDVTIRHDALFSAAKHISVHAGALTIQFPGTELEHLLQLLAGSGSACSGGETAAAGSSGGMLRTLRLSARLLQFEGLPVGGDSGPGGGQEQHRGGRRRFCGSQLRDYIAGSHWAALWGVKLQRAPLRDQETLMLARQLPPRLPATLDGSPAPMPGVAAFPPATL